MTVATQDLLVDAVLALAARDTDRATERNRVGYNGSDSGFGNRLAATPVQRWTAANRRAAWEMLRKYRKQLAAYGVDYGAIAEPSAVEGDGSAARRVWRPGRYQLAFSGAGLFVMRAAYDERLVEAQKAIPGRRWDGTASANTFPLSSAREVKALLERFTDEDWEVSPAAQAALDAIDEELHDGPVETPKVTVTLEGERFVVEFGYDRDMVAACREITGRRWDGARKVNTFPTEAASAFELTRWLATNQPVRYGEGVEALLERLSVDGAKAAKVGEGLSELSSSKDAEVEIPGLGGELRPFQRAGVAYALQAKRTFIADDMGTGKTVQALGAIQALESYPAVVVCPASVKFSWRDHVRGPVAGAPDGWLPGKRVVVLSGRTVSAHALAQADVIVLNWDILGAWLETLIAIKPRAVVYDESHYAKSRKAARTKAALALAKTIPADGLVLNLTGTAVKNRPIELAPQLELLGRLDAFGGFWRYAKRYCGAYRDTWGWKMDGATHLDELNAKLRATCWVRRMKRDVMSELPEKQIARVSVALSNSAEYQAAEADVVRFLVDQVERDRDFVLEISDLPDDEKRAAISARKLDTAERARRAEKLVQLNALRRVVARGKIKAATEWVGDFLEGSDEKLIVFAHHRDIQKALLEEWPDAAHVLGEDSAETRNTNVNRFQNDPACRLIVCSLQAAGIGITLTAASDVAFIEYGWTPAEHDQAEDRAHRMGQAGSVTCWYLMADDTIDDDMHATLESKRAVTTAVTDGEAAVRSESVLGEVEARLLARAGKGLA